MMQPEQFGLAFLLANWYSGATLFSLLMDGHPEIVTNGEMFYAVENSPRVRCSCGVIATECPFYREAASHMWTGEGWDDALFRLVPRFSRVRRFHDLLATPRFPSRVRSSISSAIMGRRHAEYLDAQGTFIRNALRMRNGSFYLDGGKAPRRVELFLAEREYARSPVILLVRHPLTWCTSWMAKKRKVGLEKATRSWCEYVRRSLRLADAFSKVPFMVVRYEDLCSRPEPTLRAVADHLGLGFSERMLRGSQPGAHHVMGNGMRHTFDGTIRAPTDRSDALDGPSRAAILDACGDLMNRVGYVCE